MNIVHGNDALHHAYTGAPHPRRRAVALAKTFGFGWCDKNYRER